MRWIIYCAIVVLAVGCGYSGSGNTQGEVDFALENTLQEPRYVNWSGGLNGVVACWLSGGVLGECRFYPPECTDECSDQNLEQSCCMDCGMAYPSMKVINPGDTLMLTWSGKLYPYDETHCSECECYRAEAPAPGSYTATACVFADYECNMGSCEGPDAQGIIMGASPADLPLCQDIDFTVPYTKAFLILSIE